MKTIDGLWPDFPLDDDELDGGEPPRHADDEQARRTAARSLLEELVASGIVLGFDGTGALKWRTHPGAMTLSLLRQIKILDADLKTELRARAVKRLTGGEPV